MLSPSLDLSQVQGLFQKRHGQVDLPTGLILRRQIVHAEDGIAVVVAENRLPQLQGFLHKREGLLVTCSAVGLRERSHARECIAMNGA